MKNVPKQSKSDLDLKPDLNQIRSKHEKKLSNYLMNIVQLYLRQNMHPFKEKESKH